MSRASDAHATSYLSSSNRRSASRLTRLLDWLRAERRIRAGIRDLEALDDHTLRDIGLTRAEITHVARAGRSTPGGRR